MNSEKEKLRTALRKARKDHVAQQADAIRALLFNHPPRGLLEKIGESQVIGLYHANQSEAPASGYARFFHEAGHRVALPFFADDRAAMEFREHSDPIAESDLEKGAFGMMQPQSDAPALKPDLLFVPLLGFTDKGQRLGQGGGHYDRYLADNPNTLAIGLAWDVQLCEDLPIEPHDITLDAIITPTRMYGPF
ncbi:MAG: 5-formyltetrahydrofolate cyclo-ligase [Erythrobacter sp.]